MSSSGIFSAAGTRFYIAPAADLPTTNDRASWEAVTGWVEVGEVGKIGEYGPEAAKIEWKNLAGTVVKAKGSVNHGSADIELAMVPENAGQVLLQAAVGADAVYPVKIVYDDATAVLTTPSVDYISALLMSYKKAPGGDPDEVVKVTCSMEITDEIVNVPRALTLTFADISTKAADAQVKSVNSPVAGTIRKITSRLNAPLAAGDATLTGKIGSTAITDGAITITQSGSAIGDIDIVYPSALKTVAIGSVISLTGGGASTATGTASCTVEIVPN